MEFEVHTLREANLQKFYDYSFTYRKNLSGSNDYRNLIPFSAAMAMQEILQNQERWYEQGGYYKNGKIIEIYQAEFVERPQWMTIDDKT